MKVESIIIKETYDSVHNIATISNEESVVAPT